MDRILHALLNVSYKPQDMVIRDFCEEALVTRKFVVQQIKNYDIAVYIYFSAGNSRYVIRLDRQTAQFHLWGGDLDVTDSWPAINSLLEEIGSHVS